MKTSLIILIASFIGSISYAGLELHVVECSMPSVIEEAQNLYTQDTDTVTKARIAKALTRTIVSSGDPLSAENRIYTATEYFNKLALNSANIDLEMLGGKIDLKKLSYENVSCTRLNTGKY